MAASAGSFEELAGDAIRDFAQSRSIGIEKYGALLARFGKGEIALTAFSEEAFKLALEEGARYAQDTVKLGGAWFNFFSQLTPTLAGEPITRKNASASKSREKSSKTKSGKARETSPRKPRAAVSRKTSERAAG